MRLLSLNVWSNRTSYFFSLFLVLPTLLKFAPTAPVSGSGIKRLKFQSGGTEKRIGNRAIDEGRSNCRSIHSRGGKRVENLIREDRVAERVDTGLLPEHSGKIPLPERVWW